jgi:hypothetical protein
MEKNLFTTGNIRKFFTTAQNDLPGNVSGLVKKLDASYGDAAYAVVESAQGQPALIEPVIRGMISSHSYGVTLITKGWGGNA